MWKPKQLLHPEVITALFMGGFKPLEVEFLGWLSYNAAALNNSRNPVKAAHTILAKASDEANRLHAMLTTFHNRKLESIRPVEVEEHDYADNLFRGLEHDIQTSIIQGAMNATTYDKDTDAGISDGEESVTTDRYDEDGELIPREKVNEPDEEYEA